MIVSKQNEKKKTYESQGQLRYAGGSVLRYGCACTGLVIIQLVNETKKEHSTCRCDHLVVWPMLVSGASTGW